jgi:undecaprenyl diphosphate synthase
VVVVIYWLYERLLERTLQILPGQVCLLISAEDLALAPHKLLEVTRWSRDLGIQGVTFHISTRNPASVERFLPEIRQVAGIARLHLLCGDRQEESGEGMDVTVAVGKSGREEITACIRRMAEEQVPPEEVTEEKVESYLTFKYTPDLVIKSGGDHLTDFLIWQSVYSELFFLDVNWDLFRRVDFLRALRDFQARKRRFGK